MTGAIEQALDALYEAVSYAGLAAHDLAGPMERENAKDTYEHAKRCIEALAAVEVAKPAPELFACRDCGKMTPAKYCCVECVHGPAPEAVEPLRAALAELVACKDLKYEAAELERTAQYFAAHSKRVDYQGRMPAAWESARAALSHSAPETAPERCRFNAEKRCYLPTDCEKGGCAWAAPETAPVEADGVSKDAERYRRWRAAYALDDTDHESFLLALADCWSEEQVDACIDAAMAPSGE